MLTIFLQSLVLASGGIISVGSITIVILLLISDRGWRNGLGYMLGYTLAYALIGVTIVRLGNIAADGDAGSSRFFVPILFLILGTLLLYLTQRNWRKAPAAPGDKRPSRLFAFIDRTTPLKAFAFGAVVSVFNFKNLAIFLSAVSVVHLSNLDVNLKIINVLLVTLVFCLSVIVPVLIYLSFPESAGERLGRLKQYLETHSRPIGIWVPLVFGIYFYIRGITGLL